MNMQDLISVFQWWFVLFIIGSLFLPFTIHVFSKLFDRGYAFSKIIGALFTSYTIFLLGVIHIFSFSQQNAIIALLISFCLTHLFLSYFITKTSLKDVFNVFKQVLRRKWFMFLFEELIFLACLFFWSYIRAYAPDIHGLEKYMDYGFINSILRSNFFPPADMWFTPYYINYYYFGHFITAVLTKLSSINSSVAFNLMLATLFALTFTQAFSIGANLINALFKSKTRNSNLKNNKRLHKSYFGILTGGLLSGFLVSFAGNLHVIYTFFKAYPNENPVPFWQLSFLPFAFPNNYWYPNATRFIYNTIHEFPIYSFVVSDLHGHVLSIPIVLLIIAIIMHIYVSDEIKISKPILGFIGFLLAVAYMTNAWDGIIYFLLTIFVLISMALVKKIDIQPNQGKAKQPPRLFLLFSLTIIGISFFAFTLPFSIFFKPFVSGIGILCSPKLLTNIGKIGPFLFEQDHCQKSPLWQLLILYGFFYFWITIYCLNILKRKFILKLDLFILMLISLSTILIVLPEFIYAKDIYPAHYRANTMFKLVYQSFIMLSLVSGYIISSLLLTFRFRLRSFFLQASLPIIGGFLLILVLIYPYFSINSYYGNLQIYYGLNGTAYLNRQYPNDYQAILWINKTIKNQPIMLEAQGDSYTDYARVSANTGLPTVLGWTVHEWLWRGSYNIPAPRISDVQTLYESQDIILTKELIKKYHISYIFIGDLERQKYIKLDEEKFKELGNLVFQKNTTKIYRLKGA